MRSVKRFFAALTAGDVAASVSVFPAQADQEGKSDDIVILYTNDVHCGVDDNIGYDGLKLYKREMETQYEHVILVDAGDAIQGAPIGSFSKGAYITELMNAVGYDAAAVGNHEFDYGMKELMVRAEELNCGYISANFYSRETGELLFDPYKIIKAGDKKIAFVGATTPETLFASTPVYFQNDKGEFIYGFGEEGDIYELLQTAVDNARGEGADYVIIVGHLGESSVKKGWSAPEIAAELTGVDVIIDGHSHETTPGMKVASKDGKDTVITQTGTKLANIGKLVITSDGKITTGLVDSVPAPTEDMGLAEDSWTEPDGREGRFVDEEVNLKLASIYDELGSTLDQIIGHTDFELADSDPVTGKRRARSGETNLGDLCADAFRNVLGAEIGVANGGGLRSSIPSGEMTYSSLIKVMPNSNSTVVAEITGQQFLDLLEKGVNAYPEESGSFIDVSGATYMIAEDVESSVELNSYGEYIGVNGEYRVRNVMVNGEPLDLDRKYLVGGVDYLFKNAVKKYFIGGKCKIVKNDVMPDTEILIKYIKEELGGVIPDEYSDPLGQGRIVVTTAAEADAAAAGTNGLPEGVVPVTWEPSPENLIIRTDEARELYDRIKAGDYPPAEELRNTDTVKSIDALSAYYIGIYGITAEIDTPEREQLREDVKRQFLSIGSARTASIDEATGKHNYVYDGELERGYLAELVIGLPAAGKSTLVSDPDSEAMKAFILDSDVVKTLLPEFIESHGCAADAVHKESSNINASIIKEFTEGSMKGVNVVIPTIGDDFDKLMRKYVTPFEEAGYNVKMKFVEADVDASMARNLARELDTGRIISSDVVFGYGTKPLETYQKIRYMTNSFGEYYGLTALSTDSDVAAETSENPATGVQEPMFIFMAVSLAGIAASMRTKKK